MINKDQIFLEIAMNKFFDVETKNKVSTKSITPNSKNVQFKKIKTSSKEPEKKSFLGGLFNSYNIKDKSATCIVINSESKVLKRPVKKFEILLCKEKDKDFLTLPIITLTKNEPCESEEDMVVKIVQYSMNIFPYFYDVELHNCCVNNYIRTTDLNFFMFPFTQGEWTGKPVRPRPPAYPDFEELQWIDLVQMVENQSYAKDHPISEVTTTVLSWILPFYY